MPNRDCYIPDSLDAIVETSERSEDDLFSDTNMEYTKDNDHHHEITLEPMIRSEIALSGSLSFGMPETILEETDEEDDTVSSCDSIDVAGKENKYGDMSAKSKTSNNRLSASGKERNLKQLTGQLSVSDFETGSVALFNFDDSSDDEGQSRSEKSSISIPLPNREDEDDEPLSWRLDPSESLSDWSICVHNIQSNASTEYHVHRNMLAVGKRKSSFFVDLFKRRPPDTITDFYFCEDAASFVPMVLDWIYIGDSAIRLSTESAPGLRYLAQCFGLRKLFDKTMEFMKSDLSEQTLATYYSKAIALEDEKILNVVARFFARRIEIIDTDNDIMKIMTPKFFLKILSQPGLDRPDSIVHKTLMISSFCEKHRTDLTEDDFLELTDVEYLPQVYYGAAIKFLELELEIALDSIERLYQNEEPTSLQTRCINAIAPRWKEVVEVQRETVESIMKRLPSFIATKIMMQALETASRDIDQQISNTKIEVSALRKRVKARVKAVYSKKVQHLNEVCKQKDEEILLRNKELARFTRLPNSFDGRLSASRGSTKPDLLPVFGNHEEAGYILTGRKLSGASFPIFYYK